MRNLAHLLLHVSKELWQHVHNMPNREEHMAGGQQRSVIQQTPAEVGKSSQQAASCESTSVGLHVKNQAPQRV